MIRYAITNGAHFGDDVNAMLRALEADALRWASERIDFVQLREKAVSCAALYTAAKTMAEIFHDFGGHTKLLVNARTDVAVAAGADGVHLTSLKGELTPHQVRRVFSRAGFPNALVSVACHTVAEVVQARDDNADLVLFGPVFEKRVGGKLVVEGSGLARLREACAAARDVTVLALGGVDDSNIAACLHAGAHGVAAIRMFATQRV